MKNCFIVVWLLIFFQQACKTVKPIRETVLDNKEYVSDSIYYSIPELPRLCDELKLQGQYVSIGDCKLYVEREGKGIPMVLINGGPGGTHHDFHPVFSSLSKKHEIIYYDQRGTGRSDFHKGSGYSFRQAAEDLEQLRIQLGIAKWIVCGYSYGGGLAQFYTARYPENVMGLVLIGAAPMFKHEEFKNLQQKYITENEVKQKNAIVVLMREGKISSTQLLYNYLMNGDWKRQSMYKPSKEEIARAALYEWVNDKGFNSAVSKSYGGYNFKNLFDNCPVPTLVTEGLDDLTWGNAKAEIFRKNHPHAQYAAFVNCAHEVFEEQPEQFFKVLKRFTAGIKPVPAALIQKWKEQTQPILVTQIAADTLTLVK